MAKKTVSAYPARATFSALQWLFIQRDRLRKSGPEITAALRRLAQAQGIAPGADVQARVLMLADHMGGPDQLAAALRRELG